MKITEIIESKRWKNIRTGETASIYGAVPWTGNTEKQDWIMETVGYSWKLDNGTIGLGRVPAKTKEEAEEVMKRFNEGK